MPLRIRQQYWTVYSYIHRKDVYILFYCVIFSIVTLELFIFPKLILCMKINTIFIRQYNIWMGITRDFNLYHCINWKYICVINKSFNLFTHTNNQTQIKCLFIFFMIFVILCSYKNISSINPGCVLILTIYFLYFFLWETSITLFTFNFACTMLDPKYVYCVCFHCMCLQWNSQKMRTKEDKAFVPQREIQFITRERIS